ncbi:MAG: tetratricopeptide repeat protein, partial [Planctomycetes bacterium]|nr:tetratricopeptide repeat protein [Planctomycetota bacterium]
MQSLGELDASEVYYREALNGSRSRLGGDQLDTLTFMHNMASLFKDQARYA